MRRLDPLLPFLLVGTLLWGLARVSTPSQVTVGSELLGALEKDFRRMNGRSPDPGELSAAADAWLADELAYREGKRLGLDRADPVIRRRVIQKMVALDRAGASDPTDEELTAWLASHPERYQSPPRVAVDHVFVRTEVAAERELVALQDGVGPQGRGAPWPDRPRGQPVIDRLIAALGVEVGERVLVAPLGEWSAVEAGPGWHLVRVVERVSAQLPSLESHRDVLTRDWRSERAERRALEANAARRHAAEVRWSP